MARICFVVVAGLDQALLAKTPELVTLNSLPHRSAYQPVLPAVTSTMQATLTTGALPGEHGIICNGLYTHNRPEIQRLLDLANHADVRQDVSFWEQSNALLQRPRFWHGLPKKVAMLFWQNSIAAADIVLTPKPVHTADGKTMTACFSAPAALYPELVQQLGPFPLHKYWSPMAGVESSQWIAKAAECVWTNHAPDLQLVYIPHLDFNLLRKGPSDATIPVDLAAVDALLAPLAARVRADNGVLIVAGDYGMNDVKRFVMPNLALREAGLLATKADADGKLVVDYDASAAFAMVDHQMAHVYVKAGREEKAAKVLAALPGMGRVLRTPEEIAAAGLANRRTGNLVALAAADAWLAHDWWRSDDEKPRWQFTVDIHSKPGFDTRELFFDPAKKCIAQDAGLVKGSHGLMGDAGKWPVLLSDVPLPVSSAKLNATALAPWLQATLLST